MCFSVLLKLAICYDWVGPLDCFSKAYFQAYLFNCFAVLQIENKIDLSIDWSDFPSMLLKYKYSNFSNFSDEGSIIHNEPNFRHKSLYLIIAQDSKWETKYSISNRWQFGSTNKYLGCYRVDYIDLKANHFRFY